MLIRRRACPPSQSASITAAPPPSPATGWPSRGTQPRPTGSGPSISQSRRTAATTIRKSLIFPSKKKQWCGSGRIRNFFTGPDLKLFVPEVRMKEQINLNFISNFRPGFWISSDKLVESSFWLIIKCFYDFQICLNNMGRIQIQNSTNLDNNTAKTLSSYTA